MAVLCRKVQRSKWEQAANLASHEISADAVTSDLRTKGNALSFWRCESSDVKDLERAVLALAANADDFDKIDVAWIDYSKPEKNQVSSERTDGITPVNELKPYHVDLVRLDLSRLSAIATWISCAIKKNDVHRWTKAEVKAIVIAAVKAGRVKAENLSEKLRSRLPPAIRETST